MPEYNYACNECGKTFIATHGYHETLKKCPNCKKDALRKVIGRIAVHFKGGGWSEK